MIGSSSKYHLLEKGKGGKHRIKGGPVKEKACRGDANWIELPTSLPAKIYRKTVGKKSKKKKKRKALNKRKGGLFLWGVLRWRRGGTNANW